MASEYRFLPQARRDLIDRTVNYYKLKEFGQSDRWLTQVLTTCAALARNPTAHPAFEGRRRHAGMRYELVDGFETDLILYRPAPHGIDVIRVISGFRGSRRY